MILIHNGEATPIIKAKTTVGHRARRSRSVASGKVLFTGAVILL